LALCFGTIRHARASPPAGARHTPALKAAIAALALLALLAPAPARAANDPKLLWKSIETQHFRISYYSTEDDVALHVAKLAESIYTRLSPAVGWSPSERTEIALTDQTDSANSLPTNRLSSAGIPTM
jgi:hypothetical protein